MTPIKADELRNFAAYMVVAAFVGSVLAPIFGIADGHWLWCMVTAWSTAMLFAVARKAADAYFCYRSIYFNELTAAAIGAAIGSLAALLTTIFY